MQSFQILPAAVIPQDNEDPMGKWWNQCRGGVPLPERAVIRPNVKGDISRMRRILGEAGHEIYTDQVGGIKRLMVKKAVANAADKVLTEAGL